MYVKFPLSVTVLEFLTTEGNVILLHFFPQDIKVNATAYIKMLDEGRTREWLAKNLHAHVTLKMWLPNSPDVNSCMLRGTPTINITILRPHKLIL